MIIDRQNARTNAPYSEWQLTAQPFEQVAVKSHMIDWTVIDNAVNTCLWKVKVLHSAQ